MTSLQNPIFYGDKAPSTHAPVHVATIAAGVLATDFTAGAVIDDITLSLGDRILIKDQAATVENGIYIVQSSGAPKRSLDLPSGQAFAGVQVYVVSGTVNAQSIWTCTSVGTAGTGALIVQQSDILTPLSVARGGFGDGGGAIHNSMVIGFAAFETFPPQFVGESLESDDTDSISYLSGAVLALNIPVTIENGGTGVTSVPAAGQILTGDDDGNWYAANITAGVNASLTSGAGSLSITTCSTFEFLTAAGAISTTVNYTAVQIYTSTPPTLMTLANAAGVNQLKEIALADEACSAVQIRTGRGSIMLGTPFAGDRTARIVWNNSGKTQWDAMGQGSGLSWLVDTQQSRLTQSSTAGMGSANAVAVSADGSTIIVGVAASNKCYVWTRTAGTTWGSAVQIPAPSDGFVDNALGSAVAISSDGFTVALGSKASNSGAGATWVYFYNGTTWTQQSTRLVGTGGTATDAQGSAVALASDGNTLIIGGPGNSTNAGAFWVFIRNASNVWGNQGNKRTPTGLASTAAAGTAVALSGDGNTAVIGAPGNPHTLGSFVIWTRTGSAWSQQQAVTTFTGAVGSSAVGVSAAANSDGFTIAVGGSADNSNAGAVWVYTTATFATTYTLQGSKLVGSGAGGAAALQGSAISLSKKGDTLFIGGPGDTAGGAAWAFTRYNTLWSQPLAKMVSSGGSGGAIGFGSSISSSSDGRTMAVGAPADASAAGAVYLFV